MKYPYIRILFVELKRLVAENRKIKLLRESLHTLAASRAFLALWPAVEQQHSVHSLRRRAAYLFISENRDAFAFERLNLLGSLFIQSGSGNYPKRWELMDV